MSEWKWLEYRMTIGSSHPQIREVSVMPDLSDEETAQHIMDYLEHYHEHSPWSWPTDGCGYEQHIKFVRHRNEFWLGESREEFAQFLQEYADSLSKKGGATMSDADVCTHDSLKRNCDSCVLIECERQLEQAEKEIAHLRDREQRAWDLLDQAMRVLRPRTIVPRMEADDA